MYFGLKAEFGRIGQDFGHKLVSESVPKADSDLDTRFKYFRQGFGQGQSTNLGHVFVLGHRFGFACPPKSVVKLHFRCIDDTT